MKQLIENRYIGAKVGDNIGVVDRRGFIAPDGGGGGGEQPTLFPPVVTGGVNEISWSNNPDNGAFGSVVGTIDGNDVTSPLIITQAMDGKTLVLTASEENFHDAETEILLSYLATPSFASFNGYEGQETECGISLGMIIANYDSATNFLKAVYNGTDYNRTQGYNKFNVPALIGNYGIYLKIIALESGTLIGFQAVICDKLSDPSWSYVQPAQTKDVCTGIKTVSCTMMKNGDTIYEGSGTNVNYTDYKVLSESFVQGDEFTFIVNVTY